MEHVQCILSVLGDQHGMSQNLEEFFKGRTGFLVFLNDQDFQLFRRFLSTVFQIFLRPFPIVRKWFNRL